MCVTARLWGGDEKKYTINYAYLLCVYNICTTLSCTMREGFEEKDHRELVHVEAQAGLLLDQVQPPGQMD